MLVDVQFAVNWVRIGAVTGIVGVACYGALFAPLPFPLVVGMAFSFGPLLCLAYLGLYYLLSSHRISVAAQAATLFGVIAGVVVNLMMVVQLAIRSRLDGMVSMGGDEFRETQVLLSHALNSVHLGLDLCWDIFIGLATVFLGFAMWSHPRFGRTFSGVAVGLGILVITLNGLTFPSPPAEAGSVDVGPLLGLLYLSISVQALRSLRWMRVQCHRDQPLPSCF